MKETNHHVIVRLTGLWAISESGLGGFMHALKIPFTGFFLGGFAIVIITLIANHSKARWTSIMLATSAVIFIKALASPHSPPQAYIAVLFQGFVGASVYQLFSVTKLSAAIFGLVALAESAMQKILLMTLIYGESIWKAIDQLGISLTKLFGLANEISLSMVLIATYTFIYVVWGFMVGWWSSGLSYKLQDRLQEISKGFTAIQEKTPVAKIKKKKHKKIFTTVAILCFIIVIFLLQDNVNDAVYAVLRTVAALLIFYFVLTPFTKWLINKWLKSKGEKQLLAAEVMELIPKLRSYMQPAMQMARQDKTGIAIYPRFLINWIALSLYSHSE